MLVLLWDYRDSNFFEDEAPAGGIGLFDRLLAFGNNSSYVSKFGSSWQFCELSHC
jgi:hypothetical protein